MIAAAHDLQEAALDYNERAKIFEAKRQECISADNTNRSLATAIVAIAERAVLKHARSIFERAQERFSRVFR